MRASRERLPGTNELVDVLARRLESRSGQHTNGTNPNRGPTPDTVREVGGEGVASEGANVLGYYLSIQTGVQEAGQYTPEWRSADQGCHPAVC